jgi:hypothetical protein
VIGTYAGDVEFIGTETARVADARCRAGREEFCQMLIVIETVEAVVGGRDSASAKDVKT